MENLLPRSYPITAILKPNTLAISNQLIMRNDVWPRMMRSVKVESQDKKSRSDNIVITCHQCQLLGYWQSNRHFTPYQDIFSVDTFANCIKTRTANYVKSKSCQSRKVLVKISVSRPLKTGKTEKVLCCD